MAKKNKGGSRLVRETATVVRVGREWKLLSASSPGLSWPSWLRPPTIVEGTEVRIERQGGEVFSVEAGDGSWEFRRAPAPRPQQARKPTETIPPSHSRPRQRPSRATSQPITDGFVNPYNFVPFAGLPSQNPPGLRPGLPPGHDRYESGLYNGSIDITIETATPLLLVDQSRATMSGGHKSLPVRFGPDGRPQLASSAVRGMLRSAYEAVTNSAMAVFGGPYELSIGVYDRRTREASAHKPACEPSELASGLGPPTKLASLTVADRVFGWVAGCDGAGAYRSQVLIEAPVACDVKVRDVKTPIELAPLSSPNPKQYRFYVGDPGIAPKRPWPGPGKKLRGRKIFPHHQGLPATYWSPPPNTDRQAQEIDGRFRDYLVAEFTNKKGDAQPNREQTVSVEGWIEPKSEFTTRLRFANLSEIELSALLWLVTLNESRDANQPKRHFRLGLGKPLGFGSVLLSVSALHLEAGEQRADRYLELAPTPPTGQLQDAREARQHAFEFGKRFQTTMSDHPELTAACGAFVAAAEGWEGRPIHYPRVTVKGTASPAQPGFAWFVKNEDDRKRALPDLASSPPCLPYYAEPRPSWAPKSSSPHPATAGSAAAISQTSQSANARTTGELKFFNSDKEFGFIIPDGNGHDIHVRGQNLPAGLRRSGTRVTFVVSRRAGGKSTATDVRAE